MNNLKIFNSHNLAEYTTFKVGGNADHFCAPSNLAELKEAILFSNQHSIKYTVIGGGSNLLISDNGVRGLVIHTGNLNSCGIDGTLVTVQSGLLNADLEKIMIQSSLTGLEFSGGLPGSVGGAVYMNARCYGGEFSKVVSSIIVITNEGNILSLSHDELNFSYKHSVCMEHEEWIIYEISMELEHGDMDSIQEVYNSNLLDRKNKGQFLHPSAGCIFKNNYTVGIPSGKIISEIGLRGYSIGGAQVADFHGNFVINNNNATAEEIKRLIELVESRVKKERGISFEREVRFLGF